MSTSAEWEDDDERNRIRLWKRHIEARPAFPGGKVPLGKNGFPLWSGGSERPPSAGGAFSRGLGGLRLPGGHHRKRGRPAERGVRCPGRAGGDPSHPPRRPAVGPGSPLRH